jgi:alkyldihydroxyacetonephosphate synthase
VLRAQPAGKGEREGVAGKWGASFMAGGYLFSLATVSGVLLNTFETAITWDAFPAFHREIVAGVHGARFVVGWILCLGGKDAIVVIPQRQLEVRPLMPSQPQTTVAQHCRHKAVATYCGGAAASVTCRITHVYPDGPAPYYTVIVESPLPTPVLGDDRRVRCFGV